MMVTFHLCCSLFAGLLLGGENPSPAKYDVIQRERTDRVIPRVTAMELARKRFNGPRLTAPVLPERFERERDEGTPTDNAVGQAIQPAVAVTRPAIRAGPTVASLPFPGFTV